MSFLDNRSRPAPPVTPAEDWAAAAPTQTVVTGTAPDAPPPPPPDYGLPATQPVGPRRRNVRWAVALALTALVVVAGVAVAMMALSGRTTPPILPAYLPAGTPIYVEARLDLPGDQRQRVAELAAKFPGFADMAAFERKVNETIADWASDASEGRVDYQRDIASWTSGQLAMGMVELPQMSDAVEPTNEQPPVVAAISVKDAAKLRETIDRFKGEAEASGMTFTSETYRDTNVWTVSGPGGLSGADELVYAITSDALLFGPRAQDVKGALDIKAGSAPSLASDPNFKASFERLPGDRLAAISLNLEGVFDALPQQTGMSGCFAESSLAQIPRSMVGAVRVESDRLVLETRVLPGEATPALAVRSSGLAARVPANAAVFMESRDVGAMIKRTVGQLLACAGDEVPSGQLRQIEQFLGTKPEDFLDFLGDAAFAVTVLPERRLDVGLVATVTDEATAATRLERLVAALRAATAFGGTDQPPVEIREEQHGGATITVIEVDPGQFPTRDLPVEPSLSFTVANGQLLLGLGDFVTNALDRQPADSLASNSRYTDAVKLAGGESNGGVSYFDVAAIRDAVVELLPADARATYDREYAPYLAPLDRMVGVATDQAGEQVSRALVFVK